MQTNASQEMLRQFVSRIEKLEDDKSIVAVDIKETYDEAKSNGFDVKILRKIIAIRKKPEHERAEEETLLATYMANLDMLPLFEAADTPRIPAGQPSDAGRTPLDDAIERAA
jgi:uncharacterized protein (UPF0335 family)